MPSQNEFNSVRKGLPNQDANQKTKMNYVGIYGIIGIILAAILLAFSSTLHSISNQMFQGSGHIGIQVTNGVILTLLVSSVQAWIFKTRIKSRVLLFILMSILGGFLGGLIAGILMNSGLNLSIIVGGLIGGIAGGTSSVLQNGIMRNHKYGARWFMFSMFSWMVIFSIGWTLSWGIGNAIGEAIAALFLMLGSGVSLLVFLNNTPQIEFS